MDVAFLCNYESFYILALAIQDFLFIPDLSFSSLTGLALKSEDVETGFW